MSDFSPGEEVLIPARVKEVGQTEVVVVNRHANVHRWVPKSQLLKLAEIKHNLEVETTEVPEYKNGDWVAVKAQIVDVWPDGKTITVTRKTTHGEDAKFNINPDQIHSKIRGPIPPEPDKTSILRGRDGKLWTNRDGGIYWYPATGDRYQRREWNRDFIDTHGPFDIFRSEEKIG